MSAPLLCKQTSTDFPAEADVVVIGGGIIGVSTAYFLARHGVKVALLEKGRIGAEQSSRNWGWCRQMNRDTRELALATYSLKLWEEMQAEIGQSFGFSRCGLLYLSDDEVQLDKWRAWCQLAKEEGVVTEVLSASAAAQRCEATTKPWKGGVFSPSDGTADPSLAAPLIAQGVMKLGSGVHEFCAARGLENSAGRVSGVVTEKGTIRTQKVVMAGGAWASSFCRQHGISFPQSSIRSSLLSVPIGPEGIPDAVFSDGISATRRHDGSYTLAISGLGQIDPTLQHLRYGHLFLPMFAKRWRALSPGGIQAFLAGHAGLRRWKLDQPTPMERTRILDPIPSQRVIRATMKRAQNLFSGLAAQPVRNAWAGYIDSTPDGVPVIDEVAPGFVLAAGFSGHGFGIGPGAGALIAELVTGKTSSLSRYQFQLSRFSGAGKTAVSEF